MIIKVENLRFSTFIYVFILPPFPRSVYVYTPLARQAALSAQAPYASALRESLGIKLNKLTVDNTHGGCYNIDIMKKVVQDLTYFVGSEKANGN